MSETTGKSPIEVRPPPSPQELAGCRSTLEPLYDPKFSTLGHGAPIEVVDDILDNGVVVYGRTPPSLFESTLPIFDMSKPYDKQEERLFQQVLRWPHRDRRAVVMIMVPNPEEGERGGLRYFDSVFEPAETTPDGRIKYIIDPRYIKGYFNSDTGKFKENPKFGPTPLHVAEHSQDRLAHTDDPEDDDEAGSPSPVVVAPPATTDAPDVW